MNKKQLYESIMRNVAKEVKKSLNEGGLYDYETIDHGFAHDIVEDIIRVINEHPELKSKEKNINCKKFVKEISDLAFMILYTEYLKSDSSFAYSVYKYLDDNYKTILYDYSTLSLDRDNKQPSRNPGDLVYELERSI